MNPNPHTLENLSKEDILFLVQNYVTKRKDYKHIANLIKEDTDIISQMIENQRVLEKVKESDIKIQQLSPYLLFTLFLRRVFKKKRNDEEFIDDVVEELNNMGSTIYTWNKRKVIQLLEDPDVENYVANMLAMFSYQTSDTHTKINANEQNEDFVEFLDNIQKSDTVRKFYVYCFRGNYYLFFTGMFPEYIDYKSRYKKAALDNRSYVNYGKFYFGLASEHDLARQNELEDILYSLSDGFEIIAKLLHCMRDEYLR